jgi:hypothetical protein
LELNFKELINRKILSILFWEDRRMESSVGASIVYCQGVFDGLGSIGNVAVRQVVGLLFVGGKREREGGARKGGRKGERERRERERERE